MKHTYCCILFLFTVSLLIHPVFPAHAQKSVVNRGAHIDIPQGAYFKVQGASDADFISLAFDTLDASIDLDGVLMVQGNWHDGNSTRSVFVGRNGIGRLVLNGSSMQIISGQPPLVFENLELDNPDGLTLQSNITLEQNLVLSQGMLRLNDFHLLLDPGAGIDGSFDNTTMVVANGNGQLRKRFDRATSFTFPVGDDTGDHQYAPAVFHLSGYSSLSSAWVGVRLKDEQHPLDTSSKDYISRHWQVQSQGISGARYDASFFFTADDIHGDASNIYNAFMTDNTTRLFEKADIPNNRLFFRGMEAFGAFTGTTGMQQIIPEASGHWSDQIGETTPAVNVLIPAGITIELEASKSIREVNDLTLEPGASLTVNDSLHLSGSFYLESAAGANASLIQEQEMIQVDGHIFIYNHLHSNPADDHRDVVGAPVYEANAGVLGPLNGENQLFDWQETTGAFAEVTDPDHPLDLLKGYEVKSSLPRVVTFQGQPITGEQTRELSRSPGSDHPGYHLVANPYAASINWDTPSWDNSHLLPTLWYPNKGSWATYNKLAGVGVNGGQPYIAPMQAFWVRVAEDHSSGIYRIHNDLRTHQRPLAGNQDDLKTGDQLLKMVVGSEGYSDEMALAFITEASPSFDEYDSPKRFAATTLPQIYTESDGHMLAINSQPEWEGPYKIPLCIRFPGQNNYQLRASDLTSFDSSIDVILEDRERGEETDLRASDTYSFQATEGESCNRFVLHLVEAQTGINRTEQRNIQIYGSDNQVYIRVDDHNPGQRKTKLVLFNLLGQKMFEKSLYLNAGLNKIQTHIPTGYYIIQLHQNDSIRSERIYLEQ